MSGGSESASRITAVINRDFLSVSPLKAVADCGVRVMAHMTGRAAMLEENRGLIATVLRRTEQLTSIPVDVVSFLVPSELEETAMQLVAERFKLNVFGSGSVYSEQVEIYKDSSGSRVNTILEQPQEKYRMQTQLTGICCIVVRGQGDLVSRLALETGSCVPTVTFGQGAGLRDLLGLWRITIPAEKEVVTMVVNSFEATEIMNMLIDILKLDQSGRGFIYHFPVKRGLVNMKVSQGTRSQAASMEQVVMALDELKGGAEWRRRKINAGSSETRHRQFMTGYEELALYCDEGNGEDYVKIAMAAGASGGTISEYKHIDWGSELGVLPAREKCSMIVSPHQTENIITHFKDAGVLDDRTHNDLIVRAVPKAFSYSAKR